MKWLIPVATEVFRADLAGPALIQNDNKAAIEIVNQAVQGKTSQRTRHIEIKYLFTNQMVQEKLIAVQWVVSSFLHADILTKDFHPEPFLERLRLFQKSIVTKLLRKRR